MTTITQTPTAPAVISLVQDAPAHPDQAFEAVERARAFIHENFSENITIDDIAKAAMFSKFHFTRVFKKITGMTPGAYLSNVRLQESMRLLRTTDLKVIDITHEVGYSGIGTFSSRFSAEVGVSPTSYRNLCRLGAWGNGELEPPRAA